MSHGFLDGAADKLAEATDQQLATGIARVWRRLGLAAWATVICLVAGVWVDWRFLPSALVPAGYGLFLAACLTALDRQRARRRGVSHP